MRPFLNVCWIAFIQVNMIATLGPELLGSGQGPPHFLLMVPGQSLMGRELQVSHGCVKGCLHSHAPSVLAPQPHQGLHPQLCPMEFICPWLCPKWGEDTAAGHSPAGFSNPLHPGQHLPPSSPNILMRIRWRVQSLTSQVSLVFSVV